MTRQFSKIPSSILIIFLSIIDTGCQTDQKQPKYNVLFIAIDDLARTISSYDDPIAVTPHFERLARMGVQFNKAYCQIPLCNPSRASLMTGLRPDAINVFDLDEHFRDHIPDIVTLPQLFRKHDYWVGRVGKLYHYNVPAGIGTNGLDDPDSWDEVCNPKGRDKSDEHLIFNAEPHRKISAALSWLAADGADEEQTDGMIVSEAIRQMVKHKDKPFFLGVGLFRPHTPYVAPRKYFELYNSSEMTLPYAPSNDRGDIPYAALAHNCKIPNYGLSDSICIEAKKAYYASVSFVDVQVGRLLDALEENQLTENTIVVLWSDHGYHLGEHGGIWQKRTLFEESSGAPLYIYVPKAKGNGMQSNQVVEFIDIYPTLASLCNLKPENELPGRDLSPLIDQPDSAWGGKAFTQILRPGEGNPMMGRTVKTDRWRYTEWNEGTEGSELYDHQNDSQEFKNLAADSSMQPVIQQLRSQLDENVSGKVPTTPFNPARL